MKRIGNYIGFILVLGIVLEGTIRVYHKIVYAKWKTSQKDILTSKYPNLQKANDYNYQDSKQNILILGGSVVFEDTIKIMIEGEFRQVSFCGFNQQNTDWNVLNLAFPGHTSLDSRVKLKLLKSYKFDYVLIYHGINDTRSNNVLKTDYDIEYRHIEFYDELMTAIQHKESGFLLSPYYIELVLKKIKCKVGFQNYIPKEFLSFIEKEDAQIVEKYFDLPCIRPSIISFQRNYNALIESALQAKMKPILCTYAFYQPSNYSYDNFKNGQLDYASKLFPTELYGNPSCVPYSIEGHNKAIKRLAKKHYPKVLFIDFENILDKKRENFLDICHLTSGGCDILYNNVSKTIE